MNLSDATTIVETQFAHHERRRREIARVLATLREMNDRGDDLAGCYDIEREADGRPRRDRRHA